MRKGDLEGFSNAHALLELAYEIAPGDPRVLDGFGCLAWRRGQVNLAEDYFKKALELDETYDPAYAHLALVAESKGEYQAARELLGLALRHNPLNYRARNNLAQALITRGGSSQKQRAYLELRKSYYAGGIEDPVVLFNMKQFGNVEPNAKGGCI